MIAADTALHYTVALDSRIYEVVRTRNGLYAVYSPHTGRVYAGNDPVSKACLLAVKAFTAPPAHPGS